MAKFPFKWAFVEMEMAIVSFFIVSVTSANVFVSHALVNAPTTLICTYANS